MWSTEAHRITWSPDGKWCVGNRDTQSNRTMVLLEGNTGITIRELGGVPAAVRTQTASGPRTAPPSRSFQVMESSATWRVKRQPGLELKVEETKLNRMCWSPDSRRVAAAGTDQAIRIWDATAGTLINKYTKLTAPPGRLCWNNTRESVFYVSRNASLELDSGTGKASPVFRHMEDR